MIQDAMIASDEAIRSIALYEGQLIVAGCEPLLRVWNLQDNTQKVLMGHKGWVLSLAIQNGRLYSVSDDRTVRVWDMSTLK